MLQEKAFPTKPDKSGILALSKVIMVPAVHSRTKCKSEVFPTHLGIGRIVS